MNVKMLRKVAEYIVKEPEGYNQDFYGHMTNSVSCGTECCVAGTALLLDNPRAYLREARGNGESIRKSARDILELSSIQASNLFSCVDDWPEPFSSQYLDATTPSGRAHVAKRRIEYFIKTRGR